MTGEETHGTGGPLETLLKYKTFKIDTVEFGIVGTARIMPKRIVWRKKNRIVTHEIPGGKDKTQRTSVITLWTCSVTIRSILSDIRDDLRRLTNEVGPFLVEDDFQNLQMYVMSLDGTRIEGEDPQVYEWQLELLECND
jgi:hypothetical protein